MKDHDREYQYGQMEQVTGGTKHVLTGIVIGGLVGAAAMLLLAPKSGEETRAELLDKAEDLRDRTTETVKDTVSQVKSKASRLRGDAKGKAQDLKQMGQEMLVEKLDRASEAVEAAKKAVAEF